jgi:AcrR family transcriptional regulator
MVEQPEAMGVRDRILDAALAILHADGIQGLSQVQVARRAGVRQSHLTYYFPKRPDLLEAIALRFIDGVTGFGDAAMGSGDVRAIVARLGAAIADEGHMRMFAGVIVEADGDPALRAILLREVARLESLLAALIGGDDAGARARQLLAVLWGHGLYGFVTRAPATTLSSELIDHLIGNGDAHED